jgi:transketolase
MTKPVLTSSGKPRLTTSAMIASIASEGQRTKPAPFGHALVAAAKERPEIVGLTADLGKYTDLHIFAQAYPDRFYQMGMAEQVMFGAASGLAAEGFTPFATTYAVFASRRAYDFIHQTIAEEDRNVKIVCALPGLTSGYGPSHQATEDLALMRAIPGMTVSTPATPTKSSRRCRPSRTIAGRSTCGCCAARCRWCSTSTATGSRSARPR